MLNDLLDLLLNTFTASFSRLEQSWYLTGALVYYADFLHTYLVPSLIRCGSSMSNPRPVSYIQPFAYFDVVLVLFDKISVIVTFVCRLTF